MSGPAAHICAALRPATAGDTPGIDALLDAAFQDYARALGKDRPGPFDALAGAVAQGDVHVLASGDTVLGLIHMQAGDTPDTAVLAHLAVAPVAQGLGLGAGLLVAAETRALRLGAGRLTLWTLATLPALVGFYSRQGYVVTAVGPPPCGKDSHPRVFLEKRLSRALDRPPATAYAVA